MTPTNRRHALAAATTLAVLALAACERPSEQHGSTPAAAASDSGAALADAKAAKDAEAVATADAASSAAPAKADGASAGPAKPDVK